MTLTTTIAANIKAIRRLASDLAMAEAPAEFSLSVGLTSGNGANQADEVFADTRTVNSGATENLDLAGGVANVLGVTVAFAKVKAIALKSKTTNTTNLTIGNGTNPVVGGLFGAAGANEIVLKPGGFVMFGDPSAAGVTVTAATGDILKIVNGAGAAADYDIIIVGSV